MSVKTEAEARLENIFKNVEKNNHNLNAIFLRIQFILDNEETKINTEQNKIILVSNEKIKSLEKQLANLSLQKNELESIIETLRAEKENITSENNKNILEQQQQLNDKIKLHEGELTDVKSQMNELQTNITILTEEKNKYTQENVRVLTLIKKIEEELFKANGIINNIDNLKIKYPEHEPSYNFENLIEPIIPPPVQLGGKSMKRRKYHKKHSKGKTQKRRNKRHKSK